MTNKSGSMAWVLIAVLIGLLLLGGSQIPKIDIGSFDLTRIFGGDGGDGLVSVDKQLKFALTARWAGSALASKVLTIYDGDTLATKEALTTGSDGTINSAYTYKSGKHLYVFLNDGYADVWFDVTVPKMNSKDAESATYNNIPLEGYAIGTYTTDDFRYLGTAISDAGSYNFTLTGETQTFTYTLSNTGADNTGLVESYDPIYKQNWHVLVTAKCTGTGYEKAIFYGLDYDFTLGTSHYIGKHADANALSKWKIGNDYVEGYKGVWSMQMTIDGTGLSASDSVTMQINVYICSDSGYAQNHGGSFGASAYAIAEHTITLTG